MCFELLVWVCENVFCSGGGGDLKESYGRWEVYIYLGGFLMFCLGLGFKDCFVDGFGFLGYVLLVFLCWSWYFCLEREFGLGIIFVFFCGSGRCEGWVLRIEDVVWLIV